MAASEQQQKEQGDMCEPAHHARRPMNAFLIFCKRHRGSVRSGFPHLENRAVTRVLGEWWATLNPEQKLSYTNLAQEYKDAFLNANPDFKWYKLPAPPLRTLNTRPSNKKAEATSTNHNTEEVKSEYESSDSSQSNTTDGDAIQPGKLADESQIGGLSSLFTPQKTQIQDTEDCSAAGDDSDCSEIPKPPKKRYSELPIEMKKDCKADLFGDKKNTRTESNNNNNNNQPHMNTEVDKNSKNSYFYESVPDGTNFRGERTCKGLRYQKFLAEQMRTAASSQQNKRKRNSTLNNGTEKQSSERRNSISSNVSEKTESLSSEGNSSRSDLEHLVESAEGNIEASKPEETETGSVENQLDFGSWAARKRFKAEDFNLEKKIEALPSLSLEEFQQKKKQQRTKKKKILQKTSSLGKKNVSDVTTTDQLSNQNNRKACRNNSESKDEEEQYLLVGSQKRKARKQTITRNASATNATDSSDKNYQGSNKPWCESPDLEALACLATVAANRTKLTKS